MSGYIMSVNPDIDPMDAISMSRELMRGYKWKLFCLKLSFLGWILLSLLTFGIGLIFLLPYMQTATVAFFDDIYFTRSELYLA